MDIYKPIITVTEAAYNYTDCTYKQSGKSSSLILAGVNFGCHTCDSLKGTIFKGQILNI